MDNGIDYRTIKEELIEAIMDTEAKVGSWQKKVLLLILKVLVTLVDDKID